MVNELSPAGKAAQEAKTKQGQIAATKAAAQDPKNINTSSNPNLGALGVGGFGDPRSSGSGSGNFAPGPQGEILKKLYRESGVVIDANNNVLYNPADLGSSQEAAARQRLGLPTPTVRGTVSDKYIQSVRESGGDISRLRKQGNVLLVEAQQKQEEAIALQQRKQVIEKRLAEIDENIKAIPDTFTRRAQVGPLGGFNKDPEPDQKVRLRQERSSLESQLSTVNLNLSSIGLDISNIRAGQKQVQKAENQASYNRLFVEDQKPTISTGARASVKSVVPPLQYSSLQGTKVTAREFQAARNSPEKMRELQLREEQRQNGLNAVGMIDTTPIKKGQVSTPSFNAIGGVQPQRQRVKVQTGQTTKLFANPDYAQKGGAEYLGLASQTALNISAPRIPVVPRTSEPIITQAPQTLTQEQVNQLTPSQYAQYRKDLDSYNAGIKAQNKAAKQEYFGKFKENQKGVTDYISKARGQGFTQIKILDENNKIISTVPINRAFYDITKQGNRKINLQATGTPEEIITGYTQNALGVVSTNKVKGERLSSGVFYPDEPQKETKRAQPNDPLSSTINTLSVMSRSSNPATKAASAFYAETLSGFGGLVNLSNLGGEQFVRAVSGDKNRLVKPQDIAIAPTTPTESLGKSVKGVEQAVRLRNIKGLSGIGEGIGDYFAALAKDPIKTGAETAGFIFPAGAGIAKSVPLRVATVSSAEKSLYRGLSLGFRETRPIIGFKGTKLVRGEPQFTQQELVKLITPVEKSRGLEIGTRSQLTTKILQKDETLDMLQQAGVYSAADVKLVKAGREGAQSIKDFKSKKLRDKLPTAPFENLSEGKQTQAQLSFLREEQSKAVGKLGPIKGSFAELPQLEKEFLVKAGDVDVDVTKLFGSAVLKAQRFAERNVKALEPTATMREIFARQGRRVLKGEKGEPYFNLKLKKNEFLHGTNKPSAENIIEQGIDVTASRRGTAFYATPNVGLAARMARRASLRRGGEESLVKLKPESRILKYQDIPEAERKVLQSTDFAKFQENLIEYARNKGYEGVTKPYKSLNVNAKRYEVIAFEESALSAVGSVKPSGYLLKRGTEKKIAEYLAHGDPDLDIAGQQAKTNEVFGIIRKNEVVKADGLRFVGLRNQILDRVASITSVQSPLTQGSALKEGFEVGAPSFRSGDVYKGYAGLLTASRQLKKKPKTYSAGKQAEKAAQDIRSVYEERGFDFEEYFKNPLPEALEVERKNSVLDSIVRQAASSSTVSATFGTTKQTSPRQQRPTSQAPQTEIPSFVKRQSKPSPRRSASISSLFGRAAKAGPRLSSRSSSVKPSRASSSIASNYVYKPISPANRSPFSPSGYSPRSPPSSPGSPSPSPPGSPSPSVPYSPPYVPEYVPPYYPPFNQPGLNVPGTPKIPLRFPFGGGRFGGRRGLRLGKPRYSIYNISAYIPRAQIDAGPFVKYSSSPKIFKEIDKREIKALKSRSKQGGFNKTLFGLDTRKNRKTKF